jgi:hypothetical protein
VSREQNEFVGEFKMAADNVNSIGGLVSKFMYIPAGFNPSNGYFPYILPLPQ